MALEPQSNDRPLICVTPRWEPARGIFCASESVGDVYLNAIVDAGGMPVMMPATADEGLIARYVELCDGFSIPGGQGPNPERWGEEPRVPGQVSPERDALEFPLVRMVLEADKPLFCICRGAQLLNVAHGGSLAQDLMELPTPEGRAHWTHADMLQNPAHEVVVERGTLLARCVGDAAGSERLADGRVRVQVNSNHHQCVRRLGEGLVASGRATDGVVEAVERPDRRFCLGVQWHPEYTWDRVDTDRALWHAFVAACRG